MGAVRRMLHSDGWAALPHAAQDLERIGSALGLPVPSRTGGPSIDTITPRSPADALPRSLSARYGFGEFPFHMDGAHWRVPPRYVLLACDVTSDPECATMVWNWRRGIGPTELRVFADALYRVRAGVRSFYAHALSAGGAFLRSDPGCMVAMNLSGEMCVQLAASLAGSACTKLTWEVGDLVVIDNWTCLHARRQAKENRMRTLRRMLVMEK